MLRCARAPVGRQQDVKHTFLHALSATTYLSSRGLRSSRTAGYRPIITRKYSSRSSNSAITIAQTIGSIISRGDATSSSSTTNSPTQTQPPQYTDSITNTNNSPHNNLQTFLTHAARTQLSPTSTTYLGTRYEYLVQHHLTTTLGFNLTRIGGRGDSGIDLLGTWLLPEVLGRHRGGQLQQSPPPPPPPPPPEDPIASSLPTAPAPTPTPSIAVPQAVPQAGPTFPTATKVLLQCKRYTRSTGGGPAQIRELEGSFRGASATYRTDTGTLGIMVCTRPATKGIRDAMARSLRGLCWIMLEEVDIEDDDDSAAAGTAATGNHKTSSSVYRAPRAKIRQFLYNPAAAAECGLEGVGVGLKYDEQTGERDEVQLLWQGEPIDFGSC